MATSTLIIISGPSCSGKSTLAKKIVEKFSLPYIAKDGIKEILFDKMSWSNRAWSQKLGGASFAIMHYLMETLLGTGTSFIIEANFKAEFATAEFKAFQDKYHYKAIQIMCQCQGDVLFKRFQDRAESGLRHPGHCDTTNYEELKPILLKGKADPLEIDGEILTFDTTDLNTLNYDGLLQKLATLLV